jgi:hypothetical protein
MHQTKKREVGLTTMGLDQWTKKFSQPGKCSSSSFRVLLPNSSLGMEHIHVRIIDLAIKFNKQIFCSSKSTNTMLLCPVTQAFSSLS